MSENRTEIIVDSEVPLVRITREFDHPVDKVFRAHTDAALVAQWLGPRSLTNEMVRWDCETGGGYVFVQRRGDEEFSFHGSFHEVRPGELIVQTFTFDGMPDGVALEKLTFESIDGGTRTRLSTTSLVDSFADRDMFVASGMETGVVEGYERLDELLAS
jgi:uncharacterized protein YndB with AHSA1/START domain